LASLHRPALLVRLAVAAAAALATTVAFAQAYPTQPIKFIVPYTTGTGMDTIARVTGSKLAARLGQPVVVENRPGASGNIGAAMVAKAPADGHTLMVTANTMLMAASIYRNVPYDVLQDFTPITMAAYGTMALVATTKSGIDSVDTLIRRAKAEPNKITYGSPGIGTPHHLAMELFKDVSATEILHVPYKGTAGAVTDLLAGQIDLMFFPVHTAAPHVKSGKMKALAVGSAKRHPAAPDVPTLKELGVPNVEVEAWYAFFGPKDLPAPILEKLSGELRSILGEAEVRDMLNKSGLDTASSTPQELKAIVERDFPRWAAVIKKNNITAE
jgi:tripartite-type tricarboxylate transporter receptor subunit TctC